MHLPKLIRYDVKIIQSFMDSLNTLISLLARTEGRDKVLRLIQYACLHSVGVNQKGSTNKIYEQMRTTRKLLRFLRSLEYSSKIKEDFPKLMNSLMFLPIFLKYLTGILQNLFNVLYFLSDHRVCLGELGVIDKSHVTINLPRSMKFYFLQNVFGVLHNLVLIINEIKKQDNFELSDRMKSFIFDMIRCFLDCFAALFYWKGKFEAKNIGIVGVLTSVMGIMQSLGYV